MKKFLSLAGIIGLVLVIGFAVVSCGGKGNSPTNVVKQLHTAIEKGDADKISELMTPEAAQLMAMMMEKTKGMLDEQGKITKTEETITGDTAVVKVTYDNGEQGEFKLVKTDGKWLVTLEK